MNKQFKRILAVALVLAMVLSFAPVLKQAVHAAGSLTLDVNGLSASWEDIIGKGSAEWSGSGNAITGKATGYRQVINRTVTTKLTLTNGRSEAASLSFDYTLSNGGSVKASKGTMSGGKFSYEIAAGASVTISLTSPSGASTNTLEITNLSLIVDSGTVESTFLPADEGGTYTVTPAGGTAQTVTASTTLTQGSTAEYTLTATAASGYTFLGWYSETKGTYLSYAQTASLRFDADPKIKPVFVSSTVALFGVGSAKFDDLTKAGEYAVSAGASQIDLLNSGTVSGAHTIPAGVTLLVPFDDAYTCYTNEPGNIGQQSILGAPNAWQTPYAYRTLTLAADAKITVNGAISVGAKHSPGNASGQDTSGSPSGPCGWVSMAAGSEIVLESGADLYAWGYIVGDGEITAKNGATVYENIQFTDFRGGSATSGMATAYMAFPMSQYYVQNIEVLTTYKAGASEYVYTSLYMSRMIFSASVKFMGEGGMFSSADGYVTKDYIEAADRLEITASGTSTLNGLSMEIGGTKIDSSNFVLPINSNIDIAIKSGTTTVNQSLCMLPGSTLTVDQGAALTLAGAPITSVDEGLGVVYSGAHNLIIYDADNWTWGLDLEDGETVVTGNFVHSGMRIRPVKFSAANGTKVIRTAASLVDVVFDINGTVITEGYLYTTTGADYTGNGASIISSLETGKLVMNNGAGQDVLTVQANYNGAVVYLAIPMISAQLKNGDGSYTDTSLAAPGDAFTYCADCDAWVPVAYVSFNANGGSGSMAMQEVKRCSHGKLNANTFTNGDMAFDGWNTAADGSGTAYADQATIDHSATLYAQWKIAKVYHTVTWIVNGITVETDTAEEGTYPEYDGAVPTKPADLEFTYTFAGWDGNGDGVADTSVDPISGDMTFTAVFTATRNTYDVVFYDTDGSVLWTAENVPYGSVPDYEGITTKKVDCTNFAIRLPNVVVVDGTAATLSYTVSWTTVNTVHAGDANKDHNCDVCGEKLTDCSNADKDHNCDHCGKKLTDCSDADKDHNCDVCGKKLSDCSDADKDHYCDHCGKKLSDCIDENKDHGCEYCGKELGDCFDDNKDHYCDYCGTELGICWDGNYDHHCDTCGTKLSECADTDGDHSCDICFIRLTNCSDADSDHYCDLCGGKLSDCADAVGDGDHACDLCGKDGITSCTGGTATCMEQAVCDECGKSYGDLDPDNHPYQDYPFIDNKDGQHYLWYHCCDKKVFSEHTFVDGECVCGARQSFTITWYIPGIGPMGEMQILKTDTYTYGETIVAPVVEDVADEWDTYVWQFVSWCEMEWGNDVEIPATMPAQDLAFVARMGRTGWQDGTFLFKDEPVSGWQCISGYELSDDGDWYYFDPDNGGKYVTGINRVPYPTVAIDGVTYGPDESELVNADKYGYTDAKTGLFVFDENGEFQSGLNGLYGSNWAVNGQLPWHVGLVQDGGDYYYFVGENKMATGNVYVGRNNTDLDVTIGGVYTFGADGRLCKYDGITDVSGKRYYYDRHQLMLGAGLIAIGENYYYVVSDGSLVVDRQYWVSNTNGYDVEVGIHEFDLNGAMIIPEPDPVKPDGIYFENGAWYYYENGVIAYNKGLIQTEDGIIYVRSNGQLATGKYYVTNVANYDGATQIVSGDLCEFDTNGFMKDALNGIVDVDGVLYYYVNNEIAYGAGLVEIDGSYYYVRSNGQLVVGTSYWISNTNDTGIKGGCYEFDANGVMIMPDNYGFTGIANENGGLYYYVDGKIAYAAGLVQLEDGSYIYVRSAGNLAVGSYWITNHNGLLTEGMYEFGSDGIMIVE